MKLKILLWIVAIILPIFPILLREQQHFPPEAWNTLHVSTLIMIYLYPRWIVFFIMISLTCITITISEQLFIHGPIPGIIIEVENIVSSSLLLFVIMYYRVKKAKTMKKLQELSYQDPLTNLYNRRYLDMYIEKELPMINCNKTCHSIMYVILTFLKNK